MPRSDKLTKATEDVMRSLASLSDAYRDEQENHPLRFAANRAWHELYDGRALLDKEGK